MLTFKAGKKNEIAVRVYLESDVHGREFFDEYGSLDECAEAIGRLTASAIEETQRDGVPRQVGIAVVPEADYGEPDGYGFGIDAE